MNCVCEKADYFLLDSQSYMDQCGRDSDNLLAISLTENLSLVSSPSRERY
jgi:hypothetical protein